MAGMLDVAVRTIEAWANGDRVCFGPPALLICHYAKAVHKGTYEKPSLDEVISLIEARDTRSNLDLASSLARRRIRAVIRLHSSIRHVAAELGIDRTALSRWLSGDSALGIDSVNRVLAHVGLGPRESGVKLLQHWSIRLSEMRDDEARRDLADAVAVMFDEPPVCQLIQMGPPDERIARIQAVLEKGNIQADVTITVLERPQSGKNALEQVGELFNDLPALPPYCRFDEKPSLTIATTDADDLPASG